LLAAAGFRVALYERDPMIAALLCDALERAAEIPELKPIVERMEFHEEDSLKALEKLTEAPDVIYLDPMFPARQKSALVKKKFQMLHQLEQPCEEEQELLQAALACRPGKIVIKRPLKGAFLGDRKPDYSLKGKSIRYDCIVIPVTRSEARQPGLS
jgi:16S rRNA (guanine1516-N2)-methyltransferase